VAAVAVQGMLGRQSEESLIQGSFFYLAGKHHGDVDPGLTREELWVNLLRQWCRGIFRDMYIRAMGRKSVKLSLSFFEARSSVVEQKGNDHNVIIYTVHSICFLALIYYIYKQRHSFLCP
jgi:hypothetical protein